MTPHKFPVEIFGSEIKNAVIENNINTFCITDSDCCMSELCVQGIARFTGNQTYNCSVTKINGLGVQIINSRYQKNKQNNTLSHVVRGWISSDKSKNFYSIVKE